LQQIFGTGGAFQRFAVNIPHLRALHEVRRLAQPLVRQPLVQLAQLASTRGASTWMSMRSSSGPEMELLPQSGPVYSRLQGTQSQNRPNAIALTTRKSGIDNASNM
jgi:hypothetical protein